MVEKFKGTRKEERMETVDNASLIQCSPIFKSYIRIDELSAYSSSFLFFFDFDGLP